MTLKTARMFNWKCARVAHLSLSPLHDVKSPIYINTTQISMSFENGYVLSRSELQLIAR